MFDLVLVQVRARPCEPVFNTATKMEAPTEKRYRSELQIAFFNRIRRRPWNNFRPCPTTFLQLTAYCQ